MDDDRVGVKKEAAGREDASAGDGVIKALDGGAGGSVGIGVGAAGEMVCKTNVTDRMVVDDKGGKREVDDNDEVVKVPGRNEGDSSGGGETGMLGKLGRGSGVLGGKSVG